MADRQSEWVTGGSKGKRTYNQKVLYHFTSGCNGYGWIYSSSQEGFNLQHY